MEHTQDDDRPAVQASRSDDDLLVRHKRYYIDIHAQSPLVSARGNAAATASSRVHVRVPAPFAAPLAAYARAAAASRPGEVRPNPAGFAWPVSPDRSRTRASAWGSSSHDRDPSVRGCHVLTYGSEASTARLHERSVSSSAESATKCAENESL